MATQPSLLSLDEYLETAYSPDCEYVDGLVIERNVWKFKQSFPQPRVGVCLSGVLDSGLSVRAVARAAALCVEIMSPDDRWRRLTTTISDYQDLGVPCIWVINPFQGRAWIFNLDEPPIEVTDGVLRAAGLDLTVVLSEVLPPQE